LIIISEFGLRVAIQKPWDENHGLELGRISNFDRKYKIKGVWVEFQLCFYSMSQNSKVSLFGPVYKDLLIRKHNLKSRKEYLSQS